LAVPAASAAATAAAAAGVYIMASATDVCIAHQLTNDRQAPASSPFGSRVTEHILVDFHCWKKVIPFRGREFFISF